MRRSFQTQLCGSGGFRGKGEAQRVPCSTISSAGTLPPPLEVRMWQGAQILDHSVGNGIATPHLGLRNPGQVTWLICASISHL